MNRIERMKIAESCCPGLRCNQRFLLLAGVFEHEQAAVGRHGEMQRDHFDTFRQIISISYHDWWRDSNKPSQTKAVPDDKIKTCLLKTNGCRCRGWVRWPPHPPPTPHPPSELGAVPAADARSCPRCWSCLHVPTRSHRRNPPPERPNQNGTSAFPSALLRSPRPLRFAATVQQQTFSAFPLISKAVVSLFSLFPPPPTLEVFFPPAA